jgi:hypothetical protein
MVMIKTEKDMEHNHFGIMMGRLRREVSMYIKAVVEKTGIINVAEEDPAKPITIESPDGIDMAVTEITSDSVIGHEFNDTVDVEFKLHELSDDSLITLGDAVIEIVYGREGHE